MLNLIQKSSALLSTSKFFPTGIHHPGIPGATDSAPGRISHAHYRELAFKSAITARPLVGFLRAYRLLASIALRLQGMGPKNNENARGCWPILPQKLTTCTRFENNLKWPSFGPTLATAFKHLLCIWQGLPLVEE